jgi:hypothetical protein
MPAKPYGFAGIFMSGRPALLTFGRKMILFRTRFTSALDGRDNSRQSANRSQ